MVIIESESNIEVVDQFVCANTCNNGDELFQRFLNQHLVYILWLCPCGASRVEQS